MKILFIWHAAADPGNRALLEEAVRHPGLDILAIATRVLEDRLAHWSFRRTLEFLDRRSGSRLRVVPSAAPMARSLGYHFHPDLPLHFARFSPDLVHMHGEAASLSSAQAAFLRRWMAPRALLVLHAYQNIRVDYRWPWPMLERFVLRSADAAVAGNPGTARVLAGRGFRKPVFLLRTLGAHARQFPPGRGGPLRRTLAPRVPVIGFSGRIFRGKGLHILLEACALMRKPFRLLVVGDGPRRGEEEARACRLGLSGSIRWTGAVSSPRMPSCYSAMDIFAAPTVDRPPDMPDWKEQCPRAHVEAMLSGLPLVVSDGGDNAWTVGKAGIVVPQGNPHALARALDRLCASPRLRRTLGKRARARALEYFTWSKAAEGLVSIWRKLLKGRD